MPYQMLSDTDSKSIIFVFVCDLNSKTSDSKFRNINFDVIKKTHIVDRFKTSHTFKEKFNFRNEKLKKKRRRYKVESIKNL